MRQPPSLSNVLGVHLDRPEHRAAAERLHRERRLLRSCRSSLSLEFSGFSFTEFGIFLAGSVSRPLGDAP